MHKSIKMRNKNKALSEGRALWMESEGNKYVLDIVIELKLKLKEID